MNSLLIDGLGQVYECLLISYIISPQNWVDETSLENAELVNRSWIIKVLWLLVAGLVSITCSGIGQKSINIS